MALSLGEGRVEERWREVGRATKPPVEIVEARVRRCKNRQGGGSSSESTSTKEEDFYHEVFSHFFFKNTMKSFQNCVVLHDAAGLLDNY